MTSPPAMVQAFADSDLAVASLSGRHALTAAAPRAFGTDFFLTIHHADFGREPAGLAGHRQHMHAGAA